MPAPAAISGTFSDLKTVKSRSVVQIVIEVPIERAAAVVEAFGFPQPGAEIHVAVARLVGEPKTIEHEERTEKPRRKFSELSRSAQAGIRCNDPVYRRWLCDVYNYEADKPDQAAEAVRDICGISSRAALDADPTAAARWGRLEREFDLWLHHPEIAA